MAAFGDEKGPGRAKEEKIFIPTDSFYTFDTGPYRPAMSCLNLTCFCVLLQVLPGLTKLVRHGHLIHGSFKYLLPKKKEESVGAAAVLNTFLRDDRVVPVLPSGAYRENITVLIFRYFSASLLLSSDPICNFGSQLPSDLFSLTISQATLLQTICCIILYRTSSVPNLTYTFLLLYEKLWMILMIIASRYQSTLGFGRDSVSLKTPNLRRRFGRTAFTLLPHLEW